MSDIARAGIVLRFFEFLDINCPNNNIHNIRVCRVLTATNAISTQHLYSMGVAQKVSTVLTYAHSNNIEAFLEPAVELCLTLLQRDTDEIAQRVTGAGGTRCLVSNVQSFVMFCGAGCSQLGRSAAACAVLLSEVRAPSLL